MTPGRAGRGVLLGLLCACHSGTEDSGSETGAIGDSGAAEGIWSYVAAGEAIFCGVRANGRATCWGDEPAASGDTGAWFRDWGQFDVPSGSFQRIAVRRGPAFDSNEEVCGIDAAFAVRCWGRAAISFAEPMSTVSVADHAVCAVAVEGEPWCFEAPGWGNGVPLPSDARVLAFSDLIDATLNDAGALTLQFENLDGDWVTEASVGPFRTVDVVDWPYDTVCVVDDVGSVECWYNLVAPSQAVVVESVPEGTYTTVCLTANQHACALDESGYPVCWGDGPMGEPSEALSQLSCGESDACGVTLDGRILCWGACDHGECEVPE